MEPTRLELWCEKWWADHGWEVKIIRRELAYTDYELKKGKAYRKYQIPIVPVQGSVNFMKEFEEEWEAGG